MEEFVYEVLNHDEWWWEVGRRELVKNLLHRFGVNGVEGSQTNGTGPRILEIGCGSGALLQDLQHYGTAVGLDVAAPALANCRDRGLDCVSLADVTALPFADEQFNVVIAIDVLEHVEDDAAAIREINRVTKNGGKVILTVPAFQMLWSRRDVQCHHHRRYLRDDFRTRVQKGGFRILKSTYINLPLFFPLFMMVKAGRLSSKQAPSIRMDYALVPPPINQILSRVVEYEAKLLRRISLPLGSSIACVGVKTRSTLTSSPPKAAAKSAARRRARNVPAAEPQGS
jgi:ubiquinone/menaquinone biosynthesis C-methylase UbiE